ncbi:MAG: DUF488 family protein, N3 subclade [Stenotrophobium sp.]
MQRHITGFHQDDSGDWVAELDCGHGQHVRHQPPWINRPWTTTPAGRAAMLGSTLECRLCTVTDGAKTREEFLMKLQLKRVYLPPAAADGCRILVDRLWPRGLAREAAKIDLWLKDIAPSTELRKWFGHESEKWPEFQKRYSAELKQHDAAVAELRAQLRKGPATLLFGAKNETQNNAVVLHDYLRRSA